MILYFFNRFMCCTTVRSFQQTGKDVAADRTADEDNAANPKPPPTAGKGSARWYERAYDYWEDEENCGLDDDGVLGGYGHISPTDIAGSSSFLENVKTMRPQLGDEKAAGEIMSVQTSAP